MSAFPRTILGKIQKAKIAAAVKDARGKREASSSESGGCHLANEVHKLWAISVGLPIKNYR